MTSTFGHDFHEIVQLLYQTNLLSISLLLAMSLSAAGTGLAITNPLVLYRALIATNRITPDPAQHRLGRPSSHIPARNNTNRV